MAVRRLTLAGRVGLEVDGAAVASGGLGRPGRVALAYLACERHRPVPRVELADVVWGECLPESWEQMLRGLALQIRRALAAAGIDGAAVLATVGGTFQLRLPPDVAVDTEEAAAAVAAAVAALERGDSVRAEAEARRGAEVAARQFAPGAAGVWVERRQVELRELHLSALEVGAHAALARASGRRR
jgi:DNA-binding SARP family transcriptional activator